MRQDGVAVQKDGEALPVLRIAVVRRQSVLRTHHVEPQGSDRAGRRPRCRCGACPRRRPKVRARLLIPVRATRCPQSTSIRSSDGSSRHPIPCPPPVGAPTHDRDHTATGRPGDRGAAHFGEGLATHGAKDSPSVRAAHDDEPDVDLDITPVPHDVPTEQLESDGGALADDVIGTSRDGDRRRSVPCSGSRGPGLRA